MKLYEKIQSLESLFLSAKDTITEQSNTTKAELENEIQKTLEETKQDLLQAIESTFQTKIQELTDDNKNTLLELFESQKQTILESIIAQINLEDISKQIAKDFGEANTQNLKECIDNAITTYTNTISEATMQKIDTLLEGFTQELDSKDFTPTISQVAQSFLESNAKEIYASLDTTSLQENISKDTHIQSIIKETTIKSSEQILSTSLPSMVDTRLQELGTKVFKDTLALEELQKYRFRASVILADMNAQAELAHISQRLKTLCDVQEAQKRLEALKDLSQTAPNQKTYVAI